MQNISKTQTQKNIINNASTKTKRSAWSIIFDTTKKDVIAWSIVFDSN